VVREVLGIGGDGSFSRVYHQDMADPWKNFRERLFFVVSAPSGAGKTTLCRAVQDRVDGLFYSVSATTRARRDWEVDGVDYHFVSRETFKRWIQENALLEWAEIYGELYGTPADPIRRALANGQDVILDLDVVGKRKLEALFPRQVVSIFIFPPSLEALQERLIQRGVEPGKLQTRLDRAREELSHAREYTYWILNENLEHAMEALVSIIHAARHQAHLLLRDPATVIPTGVPR